MSKKKASTIQLEADELRTLNERLTLITDVAGIGVWEWDNNRNAANWDDRMFDMWGIPRMDSVSYEAWSTAVHPEDLPKVIGIMEDAIEKKSRHSIEFRIIRPDGSIRHLYAAGGAVVDEQQNVQQLTGITLDITGHNQAEDAIRRRAKELDTLQEIVLDVTRLHKLSDLLYTIVEQATQLLDAEGGGLYLCDDEKQEVHCVVSYKTPKDYTGVILKYGEGLAGRIAQSGESLLIDDYSVWPGRAKAFEGDRPFRSTIGVPLIWQGKVTGVIDVLRFAGNQPFTENDLDLLKLFANHAAIACENARALEAEQAALAKAKEEINERKQAEDALKESEIQYRQLLQKTNVGFAVIDDKGIVSEANEPYMRLIGAEKMKEIIGHSVIEWTAPEARNSNSAAIDLCSQQGYIRDFETTYLHRNGTRVYIIIDATVRDSHVGKRLISFCRNITERRQVEESLAQEQQLMRSLMDNSSDAIYFKDTHSRFIRINQAQSIRLGLSDPGQAVGKTDFDFFTEEHARVAFEDEQKIIQNGQPLVGIVEKETWPHRTSTWVSTTKMPLYDEESHIIGTFGISRDVSDRKKAEEDLQESERKTKRLLDQQIAVNQLALALGETLDRDTVYTTIYQYVRELIDTWVFFVSAYDDQEKLIKLEFAVVGDTKVEITTPLSIPLVEPALDNQSRVICSGEPLNSPDLFKSTDTSQKHYHIEKDGSFSEITSPEELQKVHSRSALYVPMKIKGEVIGVIQVQSTHLNAYTSDDVKLMAALANLAAVAIENARLYEDTRRQATELERTNKLISGLARVSAEFKTSLDLEQIVKILGKELKSLGIASFFALLDPRENALIIKGANTGSRSLAHIEKLLGINILGFRIPQESLQKCYDALVTHRRPIFSPDTMYIIEEVNKAIPGVSREALVESLRLFEEPGSRNMYLPLVSGDRVLGVLGLHSPDLRESDLPAFSVFANNISAALENVQLYQEVQSELEERKRFESALQEAEARYRALVEQIPAIAYTDSAEEMGKTLYINPQLMRLAGYDPEEWITDNDFWMKIMHPEDRDRVLETYVSTYQAGEPFNVEYRIVAPDGSPIWFHDEAVLIHDRSGQPLFWQGIMLNITDQKLAENALRNALAEKEVLLREVHHRVKNNLQAIIYLMEGRFDQVSDPQTRSLLKDLQEQARTMALVYEQLYQSENLAEVNMKRYLPMLVENIREAFSGDQPIEMSVESEDITLDVGTAMPCGLMVTELLTNALKHAFPPGFERNPCVKIKLVSKKDHYDLVVMDNGVGMPVDLDNQAEGSMGLRLVRLWATHQMGGTFEIERGEGAIFHVTIPKRKG